MKKIWLCLNLCFSINLQATPFDTVRSYLLKKMDTPNSRAYGSALIGGGCAIGLGLSGFATAALAAVVVGGVGFTHYCVNGVIPNLKGARKHLGKARVFLNKTQEIGNSNGESVQRLKSDLEAVNATLHEVELQLGQQGRAIVDLRTQAQANHDDNIKVIQRCDRDFFLLRVVHAEQARQDRGLLAHVDQQTEHIRAQIMAAEQLDAEQKRQMEDVLNVNTQIASSITNRQVASGLLTADFVALSLPRPKR